MTSNKPSSSHPWRRDYDPQNQERLRAAIAGASKLLERASNKLPNGNLLLRQEIRDWFDTFRNLIE